MELKKIITVLNSIIVEKYIDLRCFLVKNRHSQIKVRNSEETIEYIINHRCSVSRYGDGEFDMIFHYRKLDKYPLGKSFQKYDEKLAQRLYSILSDDGDSNNINHIVCIPYWFFSGGNYYKKEVRAFCKRYFYINYSNILSVINREKVYFDANISRFYLSFKDKAHCGKYVALLRRIWEGRNVYFVEGEYSRLGVGNDLFENALSIHRIICPAINAFDYYDKILDIVLKEVPVDSLVIIALGHTATVLAYDLSLNGYQAVDLGHIDVEYEWMLLGATTKIALKNKYVNEVAEGRKCQECNNPDYKSQIIAKVSVV